MKLLTFHAASGMRLGIRTGAGVIDVSAAAAANGLPAPASAMEAISGGAAALAQLRLVEQAARELLPEASLRLAPPIVAPGKILCVGLNYRQHAAESQMAVPASPIYFGKYANSLAGQGQVVELPAVSSQCDYEVELVVIIGRQAKHVAISDALAYVFGYATGNDLSARDLQFRSSQWLYGKAIDGFSPLGPYLVTAEEVPDPQSLRIQAWVNGEQRQDSSTADMVFSVAQIIADISQVMTLEPGDLIYTGTPSGVIHGMERKIWLKAGDEVVCEVERLGRLTNTLVSAGGGG